LHIHSSAGKEEELMIKPAVFGTENVLNSVNRTPSVKAVVLTASTVSVWSDPYERGRDHTFTEDDWNTAATATNFPYFYAKTKAEQRAYTMQQEAGNRWRLCSMNPGSIWGPPTSDRKDGESVGQCIDLLSGALWPWAPPLGTAIVDVRDVAMAHCIAAVKPSASGRYLLNAESGTVMTTAARILRKAYPKRWVPPLKPPKRALLVFGPFLGLPVPITKATYRKKPQVSTDKAARELGMGQYIPLRQSVLDMAQDMMAKGMVPGFVVPRATPIIVFWLCVAAAFFTGVFKVLGLLFGSVAALLS
jgi:nucleoside-diphosphate-sugar epimerase